VSGLTVPEVLRRAEQVIGERGWCQGEMEAADGRVCAWGAIHLAAADTVDPARMPTDAYQLVDRAEEVLYDHIDSGTIPDWNDRPGRMAIEVRAALLAAAERAEATT
jgi:hypothetical protein